MAENKNGFFDGFLDITASDIAGAYLEKERIEAEAKVAAVKAQAQTQQRALHAPNVDSMQDAVNTGYAAPANGMTVEQYWQRIPKPLLYGSMMLLGAALLAKVVR